jgi:hypothetical protein
VRDGKKWRGGRRRQHGDDQDRGHRVTESRVEEGR